MSKDPKGWHGRGYLPHFDSPERIQHVVFRTFGSLPAFTRQIALKDFESLLDASPLGRILADAGAAQIVEETLLHFDMERYRILAWCVMPNHVHVVVEQGEGQSLGEMIARWKGYSSRQINKARGTTGRVWADDYFDRYMRDASHLERTLAYVENNPVAAGLVTEPHEWRFSSARKRG